MTMPSTGPLSLGGTSSPVSVAQELGLSLTATISMNQSNVRTLAGVGGSGTQWSMNSLYGKSNRAAISYTYSASTANASLNVTSIGGYSAGTSDITITVNSGVYLYSTGTGTPGLTLSGGSSGDTITLVNNGYIMGQGGAGGDSFNYINPTNGGIALQLGFNTTVNNTNGSAYIGGGGGGGGQNNSLSGGGGGGAGGGAGGRGGGRSDLPGGAGGGIGSTGSNGTQVNFNSDCSDRTWAGGGGGGRIFPGSGGAGGAAPALNNAAGKGGGSGGGGSGAGGSGANWAGGAGGSANAAGSNSTDGGGGGGGWGASGGRPTDRGAAGGSGGKAVNLNGYSITWTSGNTTRVYGSVS